MTAKIRLYPETYNYAFEFELSANLPSSVDANYGHIRYSASVVLDTPKWMNKQFEVRFIVVKPLDLNLRPELRVI